jgi:single-strand DNA-binding protein
MSSFNKITIIGYLGRDPELRYTPQGTAVCSISVATTERRKNQAGDYDDHTTWFRVTVWNRQAELANEYLAKGRQLYIEGRLRQEEYTDREGNPRTSLEVNATDIQFLGRREDSAQPASDNAEHTQAAAGDEVDNSQPGANSSDEEQPTSKSSKRGVRRTSNKQLVSAEEDEVPF